MEDRIGMATKHQITLRFRDEYAKASKKDKGVILDRMCETLGIGRSTARRRLAAVSREGSAERRRTERPRRYSDRSRQLLREVCVSSSSGVPYQTANIESESGHKRRILRRN